VLVDYGTLDPKQRNLLRLVFLDPHIRVKQPDWQGVARFVVGAFRADVARAGAAKTVEAWSMSSAGRARNSRRCGATMMCATHTKAPNVCGT